MASTFADVQARAKRDPAFVGQLIVDPKKALQAANIKLVNAHEVHRVELFVKAAQANLKAAGALVGLQPARIQWGLGFTCCNSSKVMPPPATVFRASTSFRGIGRSRP